MPHQSNRPQPASQDLGLGPLILGIIQGLGRANMLTIEVFLHRGFGRRYVGCGFMGIVFMYFFALWFPKENRVFLFIYAAAYGVMWVVSCISVFRRWYRGRDTIHSRYSGYPFLWRLLPSWKEENVKNLEAAMAILLAYSIHLVNRPLGNYLLYASTLLFLRGYSDLVEQRERLMQMNDRAIEQRRFAERFREMQEP